MRAVDTSVIVRAFTEPDEAIRRRCQYAVNSAPTSIAHTLAESYSTLTRLPGAGRLSPAACLAYLRGAFPGEPLALSGAGYLQVLDLVASRDVPGGAIYDCLIAQTALEHGATLVSLDKRAATSYALVGAPFELIG